VDKGLQSFRSWYPAALFGLHGRAQVSQYGETVEELRAFAEKQIEKQKAGA
jgi:hypothetical protein